MTGSQNNNLPPNITSDFTMTYGVSFSRCAEPIRLRGTKLKQVNPELLCKETDATGEPQDDETDPTYVAEPIPIRTKPDATTSCHTYLYPQIRMDCSNRGKLTISSYFPKSVWFIVPYSDPHCVFRNSAHVSYAAELLRKIPMLSVRELVC